jgi:hypothetical protein
MVQLALHLFRYNMGKRERIINEVNHKLQTN